MIEYSHLEGIPFEWGVFDCLTLTQEFYRHNFGIEIPNFARPEYFWDQGLDLFNQHYYGAGFRVIDVHPSEWQPGDMILMAIRSNVGNHSAILVEPGKILHILPRRFSIVEPYNNNYRNLTLNVFRHKDVGEIQVNQTELGLEEILPQAIRDRMNERAARLLGG
jgi:cell wall-associated NlpC family hydrolase